MIEIQDNLFYIQNKRMENNSFILIFDKSCYIIDPSWNGKELINFISDMNLNLSGVILTHLHSDHVGETTTILRQLNCKNIYISIDGKEIISHISNRLFINDKDFIKFNLIYVNDDFILNDKINFLLVPGHSKCSMCITINKNIFTGDHIFIEDIGRTDLDFSNPNDMKNSLSKFKNFVKKNNIQNIFPGHGNFDSISNIFIKNKYLI